MKCRMEEDNLSTKYKQRLINKVNKKSPKMDIPEELMQLKKKEFVEKKRRQKLKLECEELRQLASKLRAACVSKGLADQISMSQFKKQEAEKVKAQEKESLENERIKAVEELRNAELKELKKKDAQRQALLSQMDDRNKDRLQKYQFEVEERNRLALVQRKIAEEDKRMKQEREQYTQKIRMDLKELIEAQVAQREKCKAEMKEEAEELLKQQNDLDEKKRIILEQKIFTRRQREHKSKVIGEQIQKMEEEKNRRDRILQELLQLEYKAKEDQRYRDRLEKEQCAKDQTKRELQRYHDEMLTKKKAMLQRKKEIEMQCRQSAEREAAKKLNEKQEIELLNKRKQYGACLMEMMEENRRKRTEALAELVQFHGIQTKADQERTEAIKKERVKMLQSLPPEVFQHLPKGTLHESDFNYLKMRPK